MIGILNLNMGNLRSVSNATDALGQDVLIIDQPEQIDGVSHLIIPGVGAYDKAMHQIERRGLRQPILDFVAKGRPLLGICLGMQILSDFGEEGRHSQGLGLIPGHVRRLPQMPGLAIPHVGWNNIEIRRSHPVFENIKTGVDFYFVHSFQFVCADSAFSYAETEYGLPISSVTGKDNVIGLQFHPEKSQTNGLRLLENFCSWNGKC